MCKEGKKIPQRKGACEVLHLCSRLKRKRQKKKRTYKTYILVQGECFL